VGASFLLIEYGMYQHYPTSPSGSNRDYSKHAAYGDDWPPESRRQANIYQEDLGCNGWPSNGNPPSSRCSAACSLYQTEGPTCRDGRRDRPAAGASKYSASAADHQHGGKQRDSTTPPPMPSATRSGSVSHATGGDEGPSPPPHYANGHCRSRVGLAADSDRGDRGRPDRKSDRARALNLSTGARVELIRRC